MISNVIAKSEINMHGENRKTVVRSHKMDFACENVFNRRKICDAMVQIYECNHDKR